MNKQVRIITVTSLALLGILCISSGIMYSNLKENNIDKKILIVVEQKQISKNEDIDIKLKNLTIEVNTPLSVKIIDYLDSAVSDEVLANLKLDTSSVNVTEAGTYNYTVKYKKKTYKGIIIVKEKEVETNTLQSITLRTLNIKIGTALNTDLSTYIIEPLNDEQKNSMILDLSSVNVNKAGTYQYTIRFNNSIYTGNIIITEDQPTLSTNIDNNNQQQTPPNQNQQQQQEENNSTTDNNETNIN